MRASLISVLLAGGMLALGACSASVQGSPMTLAERTEQCARVVRAELVPTGRQTGDARNDYDCRSPHVARPDRVRYASAQRNHAIDRTLKNGG